MLKTLYFRWQFFFPPIARLRKYVLWKINISILWVFLLKYNIFEAEKKEVDQFRPFWVHNIDFSKYGEVAIFFGIFLKKNWHFLRNHYMDLQHSVMRVKTYFIWKVQLSRVLKIQTWDQMVKNSSHNSFFSLSLWCYFCVEAQLFFQCKKNFQNAFFNFNQNPYIQMFKSLVPSFVCRDLAKKWKLQPGSFFLQKISNDFPIHSVPQKYQMAYT